MSRKSVSLFKAVQFLCCICLLLSYGVMSSQDFSPDYLTFHSNYTPVTPNASNFLQYGNTPVDMSTGIPQVSIPIVTIEEDGVSIPISISYYASGVPVDQMASPVGLMWSLNVGGGIYRQANDKADEVGWFNPALRGDLTNLNVNNIEDEQTQDNIALSKSLKDYYPDNFTYNFLGSNGDFIFKDDGQIALEYKNPLQLQKINLAGQSYRFLAKDTNGNTYNFGLNNSSLEHNVTSAITIDDGNAPSTIDRVSNVSGWMLDHITTKNSSTISFGYEPYQFSYLLTNQSHSLRRSLTCYEPIGGGAAAYSCGCEGSSSSVDAQNGTYDVRFSTTATLNNSINQLPSYVETDAVKVSFIYADFDNGISNTEIEANNLPYWRRKLTTIVILDKIKNKTRSFNFTYSTFSGDPRMRLDQVQEIGYNGVTKPAYKFYYQSGDLPAKGTTGKDLYGYNNGKGINQTLVPFSQNAFDLFGPSDREKLADRTLNENNLKIGVLNKIEYPTGGSTVFEYQPNAVEIPYNPDAPNTQTTTRYLTLANQDYQDTFVEGSETVFRKPFSIVLDDANTVHYSSLSSVCDGNANIDCSTFNIVRQVPDSSDPDGNVIFQPVDKIVSSSGSVDVPVGDYFLELRVETAILNANGHPSNTDFRVEVNINYEIPDINTDDNGNATVTVYRGGLKIKKVNDLDTDGSLQTTRSYAYKGLKGNGFSLENSIKAYPGDISGERIVFSSQDQTSHPALVKSGYYYEEVQRIETANNSKSRTVEYFDRRFRNKSIASNMIKQEFYRDNILLKQVTMEYENTSIDSQAYWVIADADQCYTKDVGFGGGNPYYYGYGYPENRVYRFYKNILSKRTELDLFNQEDLFPEVTEDTSGDGDIIIPDDPQTPINYTGMTLKVLEFTYNDNLQPLTTILDERYSVTSLEDLENENFTINTQDDISRIEYEYVDNYASVNATMQSLLLDNQVSIPVSKKVYVNDLLTQGQYLELDSNGNVIATYRYGKGNTFTDPTPNYVPDTYELFNQFQIEGEKPVQVIRDDGSPVALLWDQTQTYLLAQCANLTKNQLDTIVTSAIDLSTTSNATLSGIFASLRQAFPSAQITSYTYEPLVGITSQTDPRGYTMYYSYDDLNRLIYVKDQNGKVYSKNEYNYNINN